MTRTVGGSIFFRLAKVFGVGYKMNYATGEREYTHELNFKFWLPTMKFELDATDGFTSNIKDLWGSGKKADPKFLTAAALTVVPIIIDLIKVCVYVVCVHGVCVHGVCVHELWCMCVSCVHVWAMHPWAETNRPPLPPKFFMEFRHHVAHMDEEESGSGKKKGGGIRRKAKTIYEYAKKTGKAFAADLAKVRTVTG